MTIDLDGIRRDAEATILAKPHRAAVARAHDCLTLLDELEKQAATPPGNVDREQIRQYAEGYLAEQSWSIALEPMSAAEHLSRTVLSLLAELEQTETLLGISVDDAGTTWHSAVASLRGERQARQQLEAQLAQAEADRDEARSLAGVWSRKLDQAVQTARQAWREA